MWHRLGKGGKRYWGKRGAGIIFTDGQSVLLLRRSHKGDMATTWTIPGGKVEEGETFLGGAQRETREETGHLPNCTRLGQFDHQDGRFVFKSFLCRVDKQFQCKLSDEHTNARWVPLDEVDNFRLHPGFKDIWPSVLRTIREKVPSCDKEMDETQLHNDVMEKRSYRAWEMQRFLNECRKNSPVINEGFWRSRKSPPGPTPPGGHGSLGLAKKFGKPAYSPQFLAWVHEVGADLGVEQPMPPHVEKALAAILWRAAPPPMGNPQGGVVLVSWFETVIDSIIEAAKAKYGPKFSLNVPEVRDAREPYQLLRFLRTKMPNDTFNDNLALEGGIAGAGADYDRHFRERSIQYYNRVQMSHLLPGEAGGPSPPGPPPGPNKSPTIEFALKMPKEAFMNSKKLKPIADIKVMLNKIALAVGEGGFVADDTVVNDLLVTLGLAASP
jgi:8-oxo-dGTP pyrophosphatase MutT (NUDIX family)